MVTNAHGDQALSPTQLPDNSDASLAFGNLVHRVLLLTVIVLWLPACAATPDQPGEPTPTETDDAAAAPAASEVATDEVAGEPVGSLTFTGTDDVTWAAPDVATPAGLVEITLECGPELSHSLRIDGVNDDQTLAGCLGGGTSTKLVTLNPGSYTFACTLPRHQDMVGTLTVG